MKRKKERGKKSHKSYKIYIYRYKIDNKYQKTKIKNLEQSLEFQKYNVKEKTMKNKEKKTNKNKVTKIIKKIQVQN